MQKLFLGIVCVLLLASFPSLTTIAGGKKNAPIKCWHSKEGVRECGAVVPPEYSQTRYQIITEQGQIISEIDRALTTEERVELARKKQLEIKEKERIRRQENLDHALLNSYLKAEDIEREKEENLRLVNSQINALKEKKERLLEELDKYLGIESGTASPGEELKENKAKTASTIGREIENLDLGAKTHALLDKNEASLQKKEKQLKKISEKYDAKISRFKELKGITQ